MILRRLPSILLILLMPQLLVADNQYTTPIRKSELDQTPFIVGKLKIVINKFKANSIISSESRTAGIGYMEVVVENISTEFVTFNPARLSLVSRDNEQVGILGLNHRNEIYPAYEIKLAPRARMKEQLSLTDKIELPARLYYEDQLLGTIRD
jgi:hypothetical protein